MAFALSQLAKLWVAATLAPFGDEAFYWQESRHPAWGYSDLPPLTAWLIRLGEALAGHGLALVSPPVHTEWSQRSGRLAARALLHETPDVDAVVCGSDQLAAGVSAALREAGRRIPDDVAVTGHDNWAVFALEADPPLTTVDRNLEELGAAAVRDLFGLIDGKPVGRGVRLHTSTLVVRESTGPRG